MQIEEKEYVYPVEVLEELEEKDEVDLTHEQKITLENLTRNIKVKDLDTLKELYKELEEIEDLKDKHIYKILEIMPEHESTVKTMFSKERVKIDEDQIEEILNITTSVDTEN